MAQAESSSGRATSGSATSGSATSGSATSGSATSGSATMERLKSELGGLVDALGDRAVASVRNKVEGATGRLTDYVDGGGGPGIMAAVTGAKGLAEGKPPVRAVFGPGMAALKTKVAGSLGQCPQRGR